MNNFDTVVGQRVGRLLATLFSQNSVFKGRQVATFHNQRDFIFFRCTWFTLRVCRPAEVQPHIRISWDNWSLQDNVNSRLCARTGITVMCLRRRRASWRQKSQLGQGCRRLGRASRCGCAAYRCVLHRSPLTADQGALLWATAT